jgi:hypothetical protein
VRRCGPWRRSASASRTLATDTPVRVSSGVDARDRSELTEHGELGGLELLEGAACSGDLDVEAQEAAQQGELMIVSSAQPIARGHRACPFVFVGHTRRSTKQETSHDFFPD